MCKKKERKQTQNYQKKKKKITFLWRESKPQTINMFGQHLNNSKIHLRKISKVLMVKAVPFLRVIIELRACLHGGEGAQVGEVTRLGGVTCLSI